MGVSEYKCSHGTFWKIDAVLIMPDGSRQRLRKCQIPSKLLAEQLLNKARTEAFEGRYFNRRKISPTVAQVWDLYDPVAQRHDTYRTQKSFSKTLIRHLGNMAIDQLSVVTIDAYRAKRKSEFTYRGTTPMDATLDREVELLKRMLNYAVKARAIDVNPIAAVKLLKSPNVRTSIVDEDTFQKLLVAARRPLREIMTVAFDTGMRKSEILHLRWDQIYLNEGVIRLSPMATKEEWHRAVYMTDRVKETIGTFPRYLNCDYVFPNKKTLKPYTEIRRQWRNCIKEAEVKNLWFHDLRRSFITRARRMGISETVIMKMSGHKTRAAFDRYNIVEEEDVKEAARTISSQSRVL